MGPVLLRLDKSARLRVACAARLWIASRWYWLGFNACTDKWVCPFQLQLISFTRQRSKLGVVLASHRDDSKHNS